MTVPKYYAIASEVATIEYMRSSGLPVPRIYGYSPDSENAAGTAYILMEFVQGSKLSEIWRDLSDQEVISVICQLTQLESRMMSRWWEPIFQQRLGQSYHGIGHAPGRQAFLRWS